MRGEAFGGEASPLAAATFVAEVLAAEVLFLLLFYLAASTSRAAWSNSLVLPTIAGYDCVGPLLGYRGAPLRRRPGRAEAANGRGRDGCAGVGAATCVGVGCATLCDRSCRLEWIWLS